MPSTVEVAASALLASFFSTSTAGEEAATASGRIRFAFLLDLFGDSPEVESAATVTATEDDVDLRLLGMVVEEDKSIIVSR